VSLNYNDVLEATNLLVNQNFSTHLDCPLGSDFSGYCTEAINASMSCLSELAGFGHECIASHANTKFSTVIKLPIEMSRSGKSTVHSTFVTVAHSLMSCRSFISESC